MSIINKPYFMLFANCIPVKGNQRSIICDLQQNRYKVIPTLLYDILTSHHSLTIEEIKEYYKNEYDEGINAFFNWFVEEEWGFYTNQPKCFPKIELDWDYPGAISNAIIDVSEESNHDYPTIIQQLDELGCEGLQIRIFCDCNFEILNKIAQASINSNIAFIEVYIKFNPLFSIDNLITFINKYKRFKSFFIYNSNEDKIIRLEEKRLGTLYYTTELITSSSHCGIISKEYFQVNIQLFTESQSFNSCLNRKISIDIDGNIKNCPSMNVSYGNINTVTLNDALESGGFKDLWNINKDQIDTCKECEFRYICTDCRAFLKDPTNVYSKPLKCSYDPFTAKWN